jgi:hypothetical protein
MTMAFLRIDEFTSMAVIPSGDVAAGNLDGVISQQVTIGAEAKSAAFNANTRMVRIQAEGICCIKLSKQPSFTQAAATTDLRLTAGQTEYFGINPGDKLSVILAT